MLTTYALLLLLTRSEKSVSLASTRDDWNCDRASFGCNLLRLMLGFASVSEVSDHAVDVGSVDASSVRSGVSYVSGDSS